MVDRVLVDKEVPILICSRPTRNVTVTDAKGSRIILNLPDPISISPRALNINLNVVSASFVNNFYNISSELNNNVFYVNGPNSSDIQTSYQLTIPDGIYDIFTLSSILSQLQHNEDVKESPEGLPLVTLTANEATEKVSIEFHNSAATVDFTANNTPREVLGFGSVVLSVPSLSILPHYESSTQTPQFNRINSVQFHSDLVEQGLNISGEFSQVIASVPITAPANSRVNYVAFRDSLLDCSSLLDSKQLNRISVWLTDELGNLLDLRGEIFELSCVLHWKEFIDVPQS